MGRGRCFVLAEYGRLRLVYGRGCDIRGRILTAQTTAQRQAALKARRRAQGLVRLNVWAHPEDAAAIAKHAAKLAKRRATAAHKNALSCANTETGGF